VAYIWRRRKKSEKTGDISREIDILRKLDEVTLFFLIHLFGFLLMYLDQTERIEWKFHISLQNYMWLEEVAQKNFLPDEGKARRCILVYAKEELNHETYIFDNKRNPQLSIRFEKKEYGRLSHDGKQDVIKGGNELLNILNSVYEVSGETAFDRFHTFIKDTALSVESSSTKSFASTTNNIITSIRSKLINILLDVMHAYSGVHIDPMPHRCLPFRLLNSIFKRCETVRKFICGDIPTTNLESVFKIRGLEGLSSIHFNRGNTITALCMKHHKTSVNRFIKCEKGVIMNEVFASPQERERATSIAREKKKEKEKSHVLHYPFVHV